MLLGKKIINRPFLQLSPNKTWEGFVGAAFSTLVVAFFSSNYFSQMVWMVRYPSLSGSQPL
jgi:phosphatidate cytidylyltransferase